MHKPQAVLAIATAAFAMVPMVSTLSTAPATAAPHHGAGYLKKHLCTPKKGEAACNAIKLTDASGNNVDVHGHALGKARHQARTMDATSPTGGLSPADIQSAYNIAGRTSGGRTVAIVDAYGYSTAASDLAAYRAQYGLSACTQDNGCLTIMNQNGSTNPADLPRDDQGWDGEQALDLDAVSAACPDCKILLVQASTPGTRDLGAAVNTAAKQPGVAAISNSYGAGDIPDSQAGQAYNHPGIAITASTGDDGYQGASFPSSSDYVTAVGGTSLTRDDSTPRGWSESAWSGAGSGCETQNTAPAGQDPSATGCDGRASADISAVADPATGLATYSAGGWGIVGGTSLSAPLIAAMYALSGNTAGMANALPYAHADQFNDVTTGANGDCDSLCSAQTGWDGPTGLGTPNGLGGL